MAEAKINLKGIWELRRREKQLIAELEMLTKQLRRIREAGSNRTTKQLNNLITRRGLKPLD